MIHFASSIKFHGGQRTLDLLRGNATQLCGNTGGSSKSTLNNHFPHVDPYPKPPNYQQLRTSFSTKGQNIGGLHFDEMDIREGVLYDKKGHQIIGFTSTGIKDT